MGSSLEIDLFAYRIRCFYHFMRFGWCNNLEPRPLLTLKNHSGLHVNSKSTLPGSLSFEGFFFDLGADRRRLEPVASPYQTPVSL